MQAGAADDAALARLEDAVDRVVSTGEVVREPGQQLPLLLERGRLGLGPGHPRPQVVEAGVDRVLHQPGVGGLPAAEHEACRLDAKRPAPARLHPFRLPRRPI
jgi:hypothetical protein